MERYGVPPRTLAPYIEKRSSGHNPWIVRTGETVGQTLRYLDRGSGLPATMPAFSVGMQKQPAGSPVGKSDAVVRATTTVGRNVMVASTAEAIQAIQKALPGDQITFLPGTYRFSGNKINVTEAGTMDAPVVVRASLPGTVILEMDMMVGFAVSAPYWTFENLVVRGVCGNDDHCEHAFHVTGRAHHFTARNNLIEDFNAHFKINGQQGLMPDAGVLEYNTLKNNHVRNTGNPVAPVDLVAASGWRIRHNLIQDFIKGGGNRISHGGFVKGAGSDNHFLQNMVFCEFLLRGHPGQRVGLSLGGGGTDREFCRDRECQVEQREGSIRANLIAGCSDVGIYLNRAAASKITQNTLVDTGGIDVRFPESSADVQGNLVDGAIRSRDGGVIDDMDNKKTLLSQLYLGQHPVRSLFSAPAQLDFSWRSGGLPRKELDLEPLDLCSEKRAVPAMLGAFDDFSACLRP